MVNTLELRGIALPVNVSLVELLRKLIMLLTLSW